MANSHYKELQSSLSILGSTSAEEYFQSRGDPIRGGGFEM